VQSLTKIQRIRIGLVLIAGLLFLANIQHPISPLKAEQATEGWTGAMVGYVAGHLDSVNGKYEIRAYGLSATPPEYGELLMQRYGIKYREMGCVVSHYALGYSGSYGRVMEENLKKKFGRDIFAETYHDAKELRQRRQTAQH
jgi:hypothetical protein